MSTPIEHRDAGARARIDRSTYPFESAWIDVGAGRMHHVEAGDGPPLLFVHGTPAWSYEWRHLIRALSSTHRCIAPDHLGFGLSERPSDFAYTPEAHTAALATFVDRLDPGPFTLVVHDFGGPIGLPLCTTHAHLVKRLVVINTWMWSLADDAAMVRAGRIVGSAFGRFLYVWANLSLRVMMPQAYGDKRALTPEIHRHYLERFPDRESRRRVLWPLAAALLGSSDHYEGIWSERARLRSIPSLVVWGAKDPALRPHLLDRWREALPHAEVVVLDSAGHWPHEEDPAAVIAALTRFLA